MEEEGLSLLDLWKLIVKRKFLVLILFGFITISTLLFILYIYKPVKPNLQAFLLKKYIYNVIKNIILKR